MLLPQAQVVFAGVCAYEGPFQAAKRDPLDFRILTAQLVQMLWLFRNCLAARVSYLWTELAQVGAALWVTAKPAQSALLRPTNPNQACEFWGLLCRALTQA